MTTTIFGSGASTTRTYDASAIYRLSQLQTWGLGGSKFQNYAYTYDPVGNLTQIANAANASSSAAVTYAYDALNRLLSALAPTASSSPYSQSYTYDSLGNLLSLGTTLYSGAATSSITTPTILDSLNLPMRQIIDSDVSYAATYTVPSGGTSKVEVVLACLNNAHTPIMTQNGVALTMTHISGTSDRCTSYWAGYLAAPTTGTFSFTYDVNDPPSNRSDFYIMTVQNAAQTSSLDVSSVTNNLSASSKSTSATTTVANDLLLSYAFSSGTNSISSYGAGETEILNDADAASLGPHAGSWKAATSSAGLESVTANWASTRDLDEVLVAIKGVSSGGSGTTTSSVYTYAGTVIAHAAVRRAGPAGKDNPFKVRRMASSAPMAFRRAVSMTDLTSA